MSEGDVVGEWVVEQQARVRQVQSEIIRCAQRLTRGEPLEDHLKELQALIVCEGRERRRLEVLLAQASASGQAERMGQ
jgi:hypothetical protein